MKKQLWKTKVKMDHDKIILKMGYEGVGTNNKARDSEQ
jgi:hypothetical protein